MKKFFSVILFFIALLPIIPCNAQEEYTQLTNLPTIYINTFDNKEITSKENYIYATMHYVDSTGVTRYDSMQIRGRGNSTWGLAKKPYRIKFKEKERLLGSERANAKSWTLLANYADKTLIRNAIAACMGTFAGQPFTAAAQFVDLYLNGEFKGCYQISDQIEIRKKRVNITEQEDVATADSNISGGYLLEVDGFAGGEPVYFTTDKGLTITIKSPDEDIIIDRQKEYIKNHVQKFENALFSNSFVDPNIGYRAYVDSSTLASWYIATELTGNVDGFWSTYIYKEKDDSLLYWGPMWDYDIAFNNDYRAGDVNEYLMRDRAFSDVLTKVWVQQMWKDPWFVRLINRTWKELIEKGYEEYVLNYFDNLVAELDQSQKANFGIWPLKDRVYNEYVLFSTYQEGVDYLRNYITKRFDYLTKAFEEGERSVVEIRPTPEFTPNASYYYRIKNKDNNLYLDMVSESIYTRMSAVKESQQWDIVDTGDGYYYLQNRATGLVITDGATTSWGKYSCDSMVVSQEIIAEKARQQWRFVPVGYGDMYVIENKLTGLALTKIAGDASRRNYVVTGENAGTETDDNSCLWYIDTYKEKPMTGISEVEAARCEYIVTYNPDTRTVRFIAESGATLDGTAHICNINGTILMQSNIGQDIDVSHLPNGTYLLMWHDGSHNRSVKFIK